MTADDLGMRRSVENRPGDSDPFPTPRGGEPGRPPRPPRRRTINIFFHARLDGGCDMHLMLPGSAGNDGGGLFGGELGEYSAKRTFALATRLRDAWQEFVGQYCGGGTPTTYDLSGHRATPAWDTAIRDLASTGHDVFRAIFLSGDPGLVQAGRILIGLLRSGPQVISIHSDEVFVPWQMLYLPADGERMRRDDPWAFEGFLGYQHHIEHTFMQRPEGFDYRIDAARGIRAGINVDDRIDTNLRPPVLKPLREFLSKVPADRVRPSWRTRFDDLAEALSDERFDDQLMCFICHGAVAAAGHGESGIALSDGHEILTEHFKDWLHGRVFTHNPIIFVTACEGGQMSGVYLGSFGRALLRFGANCLVGPQIEVPTSFAWVYALEFFRELIRGVAVGDVVRGLSQGFADRHGNPLGLVMSLYRGMDTYFDVPNDDDPDPTRQRVLLLPDDPLERTGAAARPPG